MIRYKGLRRLALIVGACLILAACGGEQEEKLQGERIPIILESFAVEADASLRSEPVVIAPAATLSVWSQIGRDARHNPGHIAYSHLYEQLWERNIGSGSTGGRRLVAEPLFVDGVLYTMDSDYRAVAINSESGKILWTQELPREGRKNLTFGGGMAFYKSMLFITTGYGEVFAISTENGDILWTHALITPIRSAPAVASDIVLVTSIDNRTAAFSADDGTIIWTHQGFQENIGVVGSGAPAIADNTAIVPYSSGEIYGLRLIDGAVLWQENLSALSRFSSFPELGDISASPVVNDGRVYAVSNAGRLMAIDLAAGISVWEQKVNSRESPTVSGDYLFIVTNSSQLLAIRAADGAVRWATQLRHWNNENTRDVILHWRGPVLANEQLLLLNQTGDAILVAADSGTITREFALRNGAATHPIVVQDRLYILYADGVLASYR